MKGIAKSQKSLIAVNALKIILTIFTSTFLTSHILNLTPDNILGVGIFNVGFLYLSQFFVYIVVYWLLTNFISKSNRVIFLRIGIAVYALLLIIIVFLGKDIAKWSMLAGALLGIAEAFYCSSYIVMKNELVSRHSIQTYYIFTIVINNIINIVVPTLLGFLIDVSTYSHISIYIVGIALAQLIVSLFIDVPRIAHSPFQLGKYFKYLKQEKSVRKKIKYTYLNALFASFKSTYKILIVILTIYTFKTNFSLGILSSIFAIISTILLIVYKKFENNKKLNNKIKS